MSKLAGISSVKHFNPAALLLVLATIAGGAASSFAQEATDNAKAADSIKKSADKPANVTSASEADQVQNKRMQTLEGSKSRWSGQFQLGYSGSSLDHPFSSEAPNPGHMVPPPLVTMDGTFSARYRLGDKTTVGLGTGLTTQTPFQGQKHTTLADPYLDIAHSFTLGPIHNHVDLQYTQWTNHQYYDDYGYRSGATIADESFYETSFGLTVGLALSLDANTFASGTYDESNQTVWDVAADPYFEYAINDTINLRSVIGIVNYKNKDLVGTSRFQHPDVYQTLGVGIAATKSVFVYVFVRGFPYSDRPLTQHNTVMGFSAIINLF